jgi:hypothetical protein
VYLVIASPIDSHFVDVLPLSSGSIERHNAAERRRFR